MNGCIECTVLIQLNFAPAQILIHAANSFCLIRNCSYSVKAVVNPLVSTTDIVVDIEVFITALTLKLTCRVVLYLLFE